MQRFKRLPNLLPLEYRLALFHECGAAFDVILAVEAMLHRDIDSVVEGWMLSEGHCANLMNPAFDEIGLACVPGPSGSRYAQYWTQNLARAR